MEADAVVTGIVSAVVCACLGYLAFRRVRLMRGGGVDVCLRRQRAGRLAGVEGRNDVGAGWHFGVARYRGNELAWYRLTSLRPGPTAVLNRTGLEIVGRRLPGAAESDALPQGSSVVRCRVGGVEMELAMPAGVLTGFLSWLEAAPPGALSYRQAS